MKTVTGPEELSRLVAEALGEHVHDWKPDESYAQATHYTCECGEECTVWDHAASAVKPRATDVNLALDALRARSEAIGVGRYSSMSAVLREVGLYMDTTGLDFPISACIFIIECTTGIGVEYGDEFTGVGDDADGPGWNKRFDVEISNMKVDGCEAEFCRNCGNLAFESSDLCDVCGKYERVIDQFADALFDHGAGKLHESREVAVARFRREAYANLDKPLE